MTPPVFSSEYNVWVLRLWRENAAAPWRITLESLATHEREGFADLNALLAYLQLIYLSEAAVPPNPAPPEKPE